MKIKGPRQLRAARGPLHPQSSVNPQWHVRRLIVEFAQLARRLRFDAPPPPLSLPFQLPFLEVSFCNANTFFFIKTTFVVSLNA